MTNGSPRATAGPSPRRGWGLRVSPSRASPNERGLSYFVVSRGCHNNRRSSRSLPSPIWRKKVNR